MNLEVKYRKGQSGFWLIEIPMLDIMTQAESREEIPLMAKDAIECLVDDENFTIEVITSGDLMFVTSNNPKQLVAFMLKRQRHKEHLTLEEVAKRLNAKSINEYAQYEQGKHLPSIEKMTDFLRAMNPNTIPFFSVQA